MIGVDIICLVFISSFQMYGLSFLHLDVILFFIVCFIPLNFSVKHYLRNDTIIMTEWHTAFVPYFYRFCPVVKNTLFKNDPPLFSETVLKLDTLVGDMEDAVPAVVNRTLRRQPSRNNAEVGIIWYVESKRLRKYVLFWFSSFLSTGHVCWCY